MKINRRDYVPFWCVVVSYPKSARPQHWNEQVPLCLWHEKYGGNLDSPDLSDKYPPGTAVENLVFIDDPIAAVQFAVETHGRLKSMGLKAKGQNRFEIRIWFGAKRRESNELTGKLGELKYFKDPLWQNVDE